MTAVICLHRSLYYQGLCHDSCSLHRLRCHPGLCYIVHACWHILCHPGLCYIVHACWHILCHLGLCYIVHACWHILCHPGLCYIVHACWHILCHPGLCYIVHACCHVPVFSHWVLHSDLLHDRCFLLTWHMPHVKWLQFVCVTWHACLSSCYVFLSVTDMCFLVLHCVLFHGTYHVLLHVTWCVVVFHVTHAS